MTPTPTMGTWFVPQQPGHPAREFLSTFRDTVTYRLPSGVAWTTSSADWKTWVEATGAEPYTREQYQCLYG